MTTLTEIKTDKTASIPRRALKIAPVAARDNNRYSMNGILVDTLAGERSRVVATDGKTLLVVDYGEKQNTEIKALIPHGVAAALGNGIGAVTLNMSGDAAFICEPEARHVHKFEFSTEGLIDIPYRDVLGRDRGKCTSTFINPRSLATLLNAIADVGNDCLVEMQVPIKPNGIIGFKGHAHEFYTITALFMPSNPPPDKD